MFAVLSGLAVTVVVSLTVFPFATTTVLLLPVKELTTETFLTTTDAASTGMENAVEKQSITANMSASFLKYFLIFLLLVFKLNIG